MAMVPLLNWLGESPPAELFQADLCLYWTSNYRTEIGWFRAEIGQKGIKFAISSEIVMDCTTCNRRPEIPDTLIGGQIF